MPIFWIFLVLSKSLRKLFLVVGVLLVIGCTYLIATTPDDSHQHHQLLQLYAELFLGALICLVIWLVGGILSWLAHLFIRDVKEDYFDRNYDRREV